MENQKPVTLSEISQEIRKEVRQAISDNNTVLIPLMGNMMDEKIKANNDILIPLIDKKIKDSIKENNEYIFENFNDQTDRILMNFKGVVRFREDDSFVVNL